MSQNFSIFYHILKIIEDFLQILKKNVPGQWVLSETGYFIGASAYIIGASAYIKC